MRYIRQVVAAETTTVTIGPFLASADLAPLATATIQDTSVFLAKGTGAMAVKSNTTDPTLDATVNGYYLVTLNATDLSAVGPLRITSTQTDCIPVSEDFTVLSKAQYDALIANTTGKQAATVAAGDGVDAAALVVTVGVAGASLTAIPVPTDMALESTLGGLVTTVGAAGAGLTAIPAPADMALDSTVAKDKTFVIRRGTCLAVGNSTGTIMLDAGASAIDDFYNDSFVVITGGTGIGQVRVIYSYTGTGIPGAAKRCNIYPDWKTAPDGTSTFEVVAFGRPDISMVNHDVVGTNGAGKINAAVSDTLIAGTIQSLDVLLASILTDPTEPLINSADGITVDAIESTYEADANFFANIPAMPAPADMATETSVQAIITTVGAAGAGLTALGDTRLANLDAAVSDCALEAGGALAGLVTTVGAAGAGLTALGDTRLANLDAAISDVPDDVDTALTLTHGSGDWSATATEVDLKDTATTKGIIAKALKDQNVSGTGTATGSVYEAMAKDATGAKETTFTAGTITLAAAYDAAKIAAKAGDAMALTSAYDAAKTAAQAGDEMVVAAASKTGFKLAADGLDAVVVETGENARQTLAVVRAAALGVSSGNGQPVTTARVFKARDGATTRISGMIDADGNRTAVTTTLPT